MGNTLASPVRDTRLPGLAPARIQRRRTTGWRMPEGAVYVGRPSKWGNPFQYRDESRGLVRYGPQHLDRFGRPALARPAAERCRFSVLRGCLVIEVTHEMVSAFMAAAQEAPVQVAGRELLNARAGLAAALAIVERDFYVGERIPLPVPCQEETYSWDHFTAEQVDAYWIRCSLQGQHDEHKDEHTGLTWRATSPKLTGGNP